MANAMDLIPLDDRIVVEKLPSEKTTKGGVILPFREEQQADRGIIIAIGDGCKASPLHIDDIVLFSPHAGVKYKYNDKEYTILKESGISARVKRKDEKR